MMKIIAGWLSVLMLAAPTQAAEVMAAVAANFTAPMKMLAKSFEQDTGHKLVLSFGSTGSFYAQIKNGAPFDVLLAADSDTPLRLEKDGLGVAGSRFTYATGRLVLWSPKAGVVDDQGSVLRNGKFQRLAIANPKLAPYGAAAMQVLANLGLEATVQPKLVQGENIAQAYQFTASENAQIGFVALSQVFMQGHISQGSAWVVPAHLHAPLQQDAIVLRKGQDNPGAQALRVYLQSEKARRTLQTFGYVK
ncbi:MAG: molybdate ABC transporter substrate-binding protein [Limnohabitans sp.]|nr:molybdate ABC transporter substrate-binding protein [Limnohabitans sp.]